MSGLSSVLPRPASSARRWHVPAGWVPALLTAPILLAVFAVIGLPLLYSLALSFHEINVLTHRWVFVGLANYAGAFSDPAAFAAFARTAVFAAVTVLAGLLAGLGMALVLNARFFGRGLLRGLVLIPWAMSPVAVGILWGWIYNGWAIKATGDPDHAPAIGDQVGLSFAAARACLFDPETEARL